MNVATLLNIICICSYVCWPNNSNMLRKNRRPLWCHVACWNNFWFPPPFPSPRGTWNPNMCIIQEGAGGPGPHKPIGESRKSRLGLFGCIARSSWCLLMLFRRLMTPPECLQNSQKASTTLQEGSKTLQDRSSTPPHTDTASGLRYSQLLLCSCCGVFCVSFKSSVP